MCDDLADDIQEKGLGFVSWAIYLGFLNCGGQKTKWEVKEQMLPLSKSLHSYFRSTEYIAAVEEQKKQCPAFSIDWDMAESVSLSAILAS
jgi:hypothetical protein